MTLTDLSENFGGLETSMGILEKFSDFQLVVFSLLIFWTYIYNEYGNIKFSTNFSQIHGSEN